MKHPSVAPFHTHINAHTSNAEKELFDWIQAVQYANYEMLRVVVEDLKARVEAAETERALANPRYSQTVADGAARDTLTGTPPSP